MNQPSTIGQMVLCTYIVNMNVCIHINVAEVSRKVNSDYKTLQSYSLTVCTLNGVVNYAEM